MTESRTCPHCGRPLDDHERDIGFELPDPLLAIPRPELEQRMWGNDLMVAVEGIGAFIRTILPVHLVGGFSIHYSLWLGVPDEVLQEAYEVWDRPDYRRLVLDGRLANAVLPWGNTIFGAPARATVPNKDELPVITSADHPELAKVLSEQWDHDYVLAPWGDFSAPA